MFGVGLIGGSFAMALKQAGCVEHVAGVGRGRANLERALELGAIDEIAHDTPAALRAADLVLVAVPVQQTLPVLTAIAPHLESGAVLTDAATNPIDTSVLKGFYGDDQGLFYSIYNDTSPAADQLWVSSPLVKSLITCEISRFTTHPYNNSS